MGRPQKPKKPTSGVTPDYLKKMAKYNRDIAKYEKQKLKDKEAKLKAKLEKAYNAAASEIRDAGAFIDAEKKKLEDAYTQAESKYTELMTLAPLPDDMDEERIARGRKIKKAEAEMDTAHRRLMEYSR